MAATNELAMAGKGPQHPEAIQAQRLRMALEAWFANQRKEEATALRAIVRAWDEEPKRRVPELLAWQRAVARARASYLESAPSSGAMGFLAPLELRLAAHEAGALAVEDALLDANYGPHHPRRVVSRVRLEGARERVQRLRQDELQHLRQWITRLDEARKPEDTLRDADPRAPTLRAEREHLVGVLIELDRKRRELESAIPRVRVRQVCAVEAR